MQSQDEGPTRVLGPSDCEVLRAETPKRSRSRKHRRQTSPSTKRSATFVVDEVNLPVRLRDYELLEKIGEGGMGQVFRAKHVMLKRDAAVKLLHLVARSPEQKKRFRREMEAVGRLHHPNIVTAFDAGDEQGTLFLAMEYIEGADLQQIIDKRKILDVTNACDIIRRTAEALAHAWQQNLVHRDIKPSNLMLTTEGEVKLLDLGICWIGEAQGQSRLTDSAGVVGTLEYMAPERFHVDAAIDCRSDLYSLGCTLYEMLTGLSPFPGAQKRTSTQWMHAHIAEKPVPITKRREDIPLGLDRILRRLLAKKPEKRPQSPSELAKELEPFCQGANVKRLHRNRLTTPRIPIQTEPRPVTRLKTRRKKTLRQSRPSQLGWYAAAGILVLSLVLMATLWAIWPQQQQEQASHEPTTTRSEPPAAVSIPDEGDNRVPNLDLGKEPPSKGRSPFRHRPPEQRIGPGGRPPLMPHPPSGGMETEDGFSILLPPWHQFERQADREGWRSLASSVEGEHVTAFTKLGKQVPLEEMKTFVAKVMECGEENWQAGNKPTESWLWESCAVYGIETNDRKLAIFLANTSENSHVVVLDAPSDQFDDLVYRWFNSMRPVSQ